MKTLVNLKSRQFSWHTTRRKSVACFLVNYDGGLSSMLALHQACETAPRMTQVVAVYLDLLPFAQPGPATTRDRTMHATAILAGALVNACMWNTNIQTLILPCQVPGPALVGLANEYSRATLFVGVTRESGEEAVTPFVDFVVTQAPCPVVLVEYETQDRIKVQYQVPGEITR